MTTKMRQRRDLILDLMAAGKAPDQAALIAALVAAGCYATQRIVSRDLQALRAAKGAAGWRETDEGGRLRRFAATVAALNNKEE